MTRSRGEVLVSSIVTLFKKIRFDTHENLGWGPVTLPGMEMQPTAAWWTLPERLRNGLRARAGQERPWSASPTSSATCADVPDVFCAGVHVVYHVRDPFTGRPTIYLYDSIPGGVGLSERVFEMDRELFRQAREVLAACPCENGCPSCVGATAGEGAKATLLSVLDRMLGE